MQDLIKLGKITAPVGIKGEVRVYPYTDTATRFSDIEKLLMDGREYRIESARYQKNMAVIKLAGINDRNAAELIRNKELMLKKEDLWEMPEDSYFTDDLLGMAVFDDAGSRIGELTDIISNPGQDIYQITKDDGKSFLVPAVKEFIKEVDTEGKRMTVHLIPGLID